MPMRSQRAKVRADTKFWTVRADHPRNDICVMRIVPGPGPKRSRACGSIFKTLQTLEAIIGS